MEGESGLIRGDFAAEVRHRAERVDHWVTMALGEEEPVTWTNDLIAATKVWLKGSGLSPDFVATARTEIEDLHWAILSGIARASPVGVSPVLQMRPTAIPRATEMAGSPGPAAQITAPHVAQFIARSDEVQSDIDRD